MKKIFTTISILALLLNSLSAQHSDFYKYKLEFGLGGSSIGMISRKAFKAANIYKNVTPALRAGFFVNMNKSMALGISLTNQSFHAAGRFDTLANATVDINKLNFSINGRYYYINHQSTQLYSNLDFGVSLWTVKTAVSTDVLEKLVNQYVSIGFIANAINKTLDKYNSISGKFDFTLENVQLTILGISKNMGHFGLYGELAIGSPYFILMGLNYKFNTNVYR